MRERLDWKKSKLIASFLWWGAILVTVIGLFLLAWPYLVSAYYLDRGTQSQSEQDKQIAISNFEMALHFEPKNPLTIRRLAQTYLWTNRLDQALEAAQLAQSLAPNDPLTYLTLGDVHDHNGNVEQAIRYYEAGLAGNRRAKLTVNYLQLADQLWRNKEQEAAAAIWRDKVIGTGYGDLYANWRLAQYYAGDKETSEIYKEGVRYFPLESVAASPDRRLDRYQAAAFMGAVEIGLWERQKLLNIVGYRVWQDQSQATEYLLRSLLSKNPDDADLRFYLGEMYHRRGDWEQADIAYRSVLDIDSNFAQAYLQMGIMAEARSTEKGFEHESLTEAMGWYEQYYQMAPNDLLGLQKLIEIYEMQEKQEAVALRADLESKTDNEERLIAETLKIDLHSFELSHNLLDDITFKDNVLIQDTDWESSVWLGVNRDNALFFNGQDKQGENDVARITTLWLRSPIDAYADYGQTIVLKANTFYVLSFYYKTNNFQEGSAFVGLLEWTSQPRYTFTHSYLSDTEGTWQKMVYIGNSYQHPLGVRLILRNWGAGNVWFDQVELRQVNVH